MLNSLHHKYNTNQSGNTTNFFIYLYYLCFISQAISGYKESAKITTSPANITCLDVNSKYIAAG